MCPLAEVAAADRRSPISLFRRIWMRCTKRTPLPFSPHPLSIPYTLAEALNSGGSPPCDLVRFYFYFLFCSKYRIAVWLVVSRLGNARRFTVIYYLDLSLSLCLLRSRSTSSLFVSRSPSPSPVVFVCLPISISLFYSFSLFFSIFWWSIGHWSHKTLLLNAQAPIRFIATNTNV